MLTVRNKATNELAETISLNGEWDFTLGENAPWSKIQSPGCWEAQGYPKMVDGPAVYRKVIPIPAGWSGKRILVEFDAVSYACSIWCNDIQVGEHRGLWSPFQMDLTSAIRPAEENILEIHVHKPGQLFPMRSSLAGFIPDVSTTFGGIWQPACLRAMDTGLEELLLDPDLKTSSLRVRSQAHFFALPKGEMRWQVEISLAGKLITLLDFAFSKDGCLDLTLPIADLQLWNPKHPTLYTIRVSLLESGRTIAVSSGRTGFRRLSVSTNDGSRLLLNDEPMMVRGILSWGWEPDRIAPFYTPEQAREEIRRVRDHGFNLVKLCLLVPNQTYFDAADEEGMLIWLELPMWLPEVTPELRAQAPIEYAEITRLARHHPCVSLYSLGCELSQSVDGELLARLDEAVRGVVSNVLICDNSGSGESYGGLDFDFADFTDYHPYYDIHYFESLLDNWRRDWQRSRPWIFGEFCDSDTYRDQAGLVKSTGGTRPWWLTKDNPVTNWRSESKAMLEWEERMKAADLPFSAEEITQASRAASQVTRKYTLETLRLRAGMGGYIVTGLRDTPISTSGIWDDFSRPKWSADEFRLVNDEVVLCLEVGRRRIWRFGGDRPDRLDAHNFWSGSQASWHIVLHSTQEALFPGSKLEWELIDLDGNCIRNGQSWSSQEIQPGIPGEAGQISVKLPEVGQPVELRLQARMMTADQEVRNEWPVWVYPPLVEPESSLVIFDPNQELSDFGEWLKPIPRVSVKEELTPETVLLTVNWNPDLHEYVMEGGRVILLQQGSGPLPAKRGPFWREAIKLFYPHPLWTHFSQRGYTDMQFFGLASDSSFDTARLPEALPGLKSLKPILRRLDSREFLVSDYILDAEVGHGRLLACSLRLQGGLGAQPSGWERNIAGGALLQGMIAVLNLDERADGWGAIKL